MLSSASALAAVTVMMTAFGHDDGAVSQSQNGRFQTAEVSCIAGQVWAEARMASFERKLEVAARHVAVDNCLITSASLSALPSPATIEFKHRREAESFDDSVLATLTAIQHHLDLNAPPASRQPRSSLMSDKQANAIAFGNILDFWQKTPVKGINIEPSLDMLQLASDKALK